MTRLLRGAAWTVVAALAALGALAGAPVVVAIAVFAAMLAGLTGYACATSTEHRPGRVLRSVAGFAAAGVAAVLVVAGLVVVVGPVAAPITLLVGAAAAWRFRVVLNGRVPAAERHGVREDHLRRLSNVQLGQEWRRSHVRLLRARDVVELSRVSVLRRHQLDEIERRDPAGFQRWLSCGAWVPGGSAPFLGG